MVHGALLTPPRHGRWLDGAAAWLLGFLVLAGLALQVAESRAWDANRIVAAAQIHGPQAVAAARALQSAMAQVVGQGEVARVAGVNEHFNRSIVYRDDLEVWGQVDYWASPLEMMQKGSGDCEDYAIAKYFTLHALGVPHRKLRLVYVRAALGGMVQPHMVLAYYAAPDSDPLVLDSLVPDIRPASRRPDLTPVFSFNAEGIWEGVGEATVRGQPGERLTRWGEVMRKARQEGFY